MSPHFDARLVSQAGSLRRAILEGTIILYCGIVVVIVRRRAGRNQSGYSSCRNVKTVWEEPRRRTGWEVRRSPMPTDTNTTTNNNTCRACGCWERVSFAAT